MTRDGSNPLARAVAEVLEDYGLTNMVDPDEFATDLLFTFVRAKPICSSCGNPTRPGETVCFVCEKTAKEDDDR